MSNNSDPAGGKDPLPDDPLPDDTDAESELSERTQKLAVFDALAEMGKRLATIEDEVDKEFKQTRKIHMLVKATRKDTIPILERNMKSDKWDKVYSALHGAFNRIIDSIGMAFRGTLISLKTQLILQLGLCQGSKVQRILVANSLFDVFDLAVSLIKDGIEVTANILLEVSGHFEQLKTELISMFDE